MPFALSKDKLVPAAALRDLTRDSFEHLALRLDDAISENASLFGGGEVARLATFSDRVLVGTSDGKVFSASYKNFGDDIRFEHAEQVDVPVVDSGNAQEYVHRFMMDVVNSLLTGKPEVQKENIIALVNLSESVQSSVNGESEDSDLITLVSNIVDSIPPWKQAYRENIETVRSLTSDYEIEMAEAKYAPLYNGSMPEEKFYLYLEPAKKDLSGLISRLARAEERVQAAYRPVAESGLASNEAVAEFSVFSEGLAEEIHDLREHARIAVENEQCAMCVGQIHDAIAESLEDYEIASLFVEKMAARFTA